MKRHAGAVIGALILLVVAVGAFAKGDAAAWTEAELSLLRGLSLASLPPLPPDPSNRVADDPRAAALGQRLFFDERLSANGKVACATCHVPGKQFQDGTRLGKGVGTTGRRTMSIVGTAYSPWQFWDGRKDSQWAQALGPLESAVEHGADRTQVARIAAEHYRAEYEALFGILPDLSRLPAHAGPVEDRAARAAWERMSASERDAVTRVFANVGKAMAAYERRIVPGASRFDAYVEAAGRRDTKAMDAALDADEVAGLRLFVGKGNCIQCHGGPLFTNNEFHNTGVPADPKLPPDAGRLAAVKQVLGDEFNCLGRYSDARPEQCGELRFLEADEHRQLRQFKPPSLRNVAERAPYMHAGQFATLDEVLDHYDRAPAAPQGHSELKPLKLSARERAQIVKFLRSLSAPAEQPPAAATTAARRAGA
jgi:cytochrome c peroxidase